MRLSHIQTESYSLEQESNTVSIPSPLKKSLYLLTRKYSGSRV